MIVNTPNHSSNADGIFGLILGDGEEGSVPWYWTVILLIAGSIAGGFVLDKLVDTNWDFDAAMLPIVISVGSAVICALFRAYEFYRLIDEDVKKQPGKVVLFIFLMILGFCVRVLLLCFIFAVIGWIIAAFILRG